MPETLALLVRITLGAVFLAAGVAKLIDRAEFEKHLPAFGVRWPAVARWMSYVLPLAEVVIGTLLIAGLVANVAASAALILLLLFTLVVAVALVRRTPVSCGCFGNIGRGQITVMTLVRNSVLLGMAFLLVGSKGSSAGVGPWLPPFMVGSMAAAVILLGAQYLSLRPAFLPLPLPPHKSGIRWHALGPGRGR